MRRDHLDVLAFPAPIGFLVLDAEVREVDLVIEVRQIVVLRPLANLVRGSIRMSVVARLETTRKAPTVARVRDSEPRKV